MSEHVRAVGRERAVAHRRLRARVKQDVRAGRLRGADVLRMAAGDDEAAPVIARMRIAELLLSIPGVGPATADRALVAAGIPGQRRLGQLGPQQIRRLDALL